MLNSNFHKSYLTTASVVSVSVHILAVIWLFHFNAKTLKIDSGIRSNDYSKISINLKKKVLSKPVVKKVEQVQKTDESKTQDEEEIEVEEEIVQIPVVENAQFQGTRSPPAYPRRALRLKQQGNVTIQALVDENGDVKDVKIIKSSGYNMLDNSAVKAVSKWKFKPTYVNNKPVLSWIQVPVEFAIK